MKRFDSWLASISTTFNSSTALRWLGGVALTLSVMGADYLSGAEIHLSVLYLVVIFYFAHWLGLLSALTMSVICAVASVLAQYLAGERFSQPDLPIWIAAIRAVTFSVFGYIFANLERKQAQLNALVDKLQVSNASLEIFNSTISHDLKTHLQIIMLSSSLLAGRKGLDEETQTAVTNLDKSVANMTAIITDLLEYAKQTHTPDRIETVDLEALYRQVMEELDELIRRKQALITVGKLPLLQADPSGMRQLFRNLTSNALKFCQRRPEITIGSRESAGQAFIEVSDNGIGMAPEDVEKAFTAFQRFHPEYEGSGLGLSLCKRIVERHHGSISLLSQPGEGTTFIIQLPLVQPTG